MFGELRKRGFVIDPSYKGWWIFHRYGSEQSMIWDYSGNDNHGVIHSVAPAVYELCPTGYEGWGWLFNWKVNGYVTHPAINLGKTHTLHYWFKRLGDGGMVHAGLTDFVGLRISDTTVGYNADCIPVAELHNGDASTAIKTLISVRRVADKVTFYQDGLQIGSEQTLSEDNDLVLTDIGRESDAQGFTFYGIIYEIAISNIDQGFIGVRNFFEMTRRIQGI